MDGDDLSIIDHMAKKHWSVWRRYTGATERGGDLAAEFSRGLNVLIDDFRRRGMEKRDIAGVLEVLSYFTSMGLRSECPGCGEEVVGFSGAKSGQQQPSGQ